MNKYCVLHVFYLIKIYLSIVRSINNNNRVDSSYIKKRKRKKGTQTVPFRFHDEYFMALPSLNSPLADEEKKQATL